MSTRRTFLTAASAAAALPAQKAPASSFTIERVADGVWAALAAPMAIGNCNSAVFELSDGLLVVDTHARPSAASAMLSSLRQQTKKPVKYVVITHIHGDHVQGMPAYRKLAPQAQFITHAATRKRMAEGGDPMPAIRGAREKALAEAEQKLAAANAPSEKTYWQRVIAESKEFLAEMKNVTLELPQIAVTRDWILYDKQQEIHVMFRGRGHTDGDLVVYSPQRRVIAAGDLFVSTTPNLGAYTRDYPRTLVAVAQECAYEKAIVGHGAVQTGQRALYRQVDYIEELTVMAERAREKKPVQVGELKSLAGGGAEELGEQIFRWRLQPPQVQSPAQAIAAAVALNGDQVYNAIK
jgi:cyclase